VTAEIPLPAPRARAAWRAWLSALAVDAEAALAAALTYESLDDAGRDAFLDAVDEDADSVDAPTVALYAPLLAVEADLTRQARLSNAIAAAENTFANPPRPARAFSGDVDGEQLTVLLLPLYLGFVEILACRWSDELGCVSAEHEPLRTARDFQRSSTYDGVTIKEMPYGDAIEQLAHAVITCNRRGSRAPDALVPFADLFSL